MQKKSFLQLVLTCVTLCSCAGQYMKYSSKLNIESSVVKNKVIRHVDYMINDNISIFVKDCIKNQGIPNAVVAVGNVTNVIGKTDENGRIVKSVEIFWGEIDTNPHFSPQEQYFRIFVFLDNQKYSFLFNVNEINGEQLVCVIDR